MIYTKLCQKQQLKHSSVYCRCFIVGSPVLVGDNASLHFLVVLPDADGQPGAQFAIVESVHHSEHLSFIKAQPIRRLFLVLKVRPDVEGVAHIRLHYSPIHWRTGHKQDSNNEVNNFVLIMRKKGLHSDMRDKHNSKSDI